MVKTYLKHNLIGAIFLGLVLLFASPVLMSLKNLDEVKSAFVVELYLVFLGVIFLVPIFSPDSTQSIYETTRSRAMPLWKHFLVRLTVSLSFIFCLIFVFLLFMQHNNCTFPFQIYLLSAFASAVFLGALGVLAYSLTNQVAVAYMVPILYFILNLGSGKKILKDFYLFSLLQGNYEPKKLLFAVGVLIILTSMGVRLRRGSDQA